MPTDIVVPELGESVVEATVGRWRKAEGDRVNVGEVVVELETEKVDLEVGAERGGVLAKIQRREGETVKIGDTLGVIEEAETAGAPPSGEADTGKEGAEAPTKPATETAGTKQEAAEPKAAEAEERRSGRAAPFERATPSARRLAQERGIDLAAVPSREESGRITREDLLARAEEAGAAVKEKPPAEEKAPPEPAPQPAAAAGREERIRMSRRRLTIARRLVEAQHSAAALTTFNDVDMSAVMNLRKRLKNSFMERHGVGLGIVSFFIKASIGALRRFPMLNAEIQGEEIVLKHYYDIGVAVGASGGLVVPVLREADRMSFVEIERAVKSFARKAEDGTLTLEDLRGGTFTISNGGVFGSLLSTPILNPPQVGILGLHRIEERPVSAGGEIVLRPMMYLALSYDHRIVDGLEAVQFLALVKRLIEDPETLLLEG